MRLGIVAYDRLAQLVIYRDPTKLVDITIVFTDRSGELRIKSLEHKATLALVSEPMQLRDISLRAELDGEFQGEAHGCFVGGTLILTKRTGIFAKVEAHAITERETLRVFKFEDCVGLDKTEIALLSRKWSGDQMRPYGADTYWWSNAGLRHMDAPGRRGITGFSLEEGGVVTSCHTALVVVTTGQYTGKTGWLAWGGNAGVAVSGGDGKITGAVWYPSFNSLPRKVQDIVLLPPESIAKHAVCTDAENARQNTDGFAMR